MSALENLKDATAKALVEAIESKNVAMVKQLFTIYYEVQQIEDPGNQFTLSFEGSGTEWKTGTVYTSDRSSSYSDDVLSL